MPQVPVESTEDPYRGYEDFRGKDPVHWSSEDKQWNVTKHEYVKEIIKEEQSKQHFTTNRIPYLKRQVSSPGVADSMQKLEPIFANMVMLTDNLEEHKRRRNLCRKAIESSIEGGFKQTVERIAAELMNEAIADAEMHRERLLGTSASTHEPLEMDLINDFARRLPGLVTPVLLGIEEEYKYPILKRFQQFAEAFPGNLSIRERKVSQAWEGAQALSDYFEERYYHYKNEKALAREEQDNLMYRLATVEENGQGLSKEEFVSMCIFILMASLETIGGLIGNGVLALLKHPGQMKALREKLDVNDEEFLRRAVQEFVRYDSSVQSTPRIANHDVAAFNSTEIGKSIKKCEAVSLNLASANRDPDVFTDCDRFILDREADEVNKNLGFGYGHRECLGKELVLIQVEAAVKTLLNQTSSIRQTPVQLEWREDLPQYRILKNLHVTFEPVECNTKQGASAMPS